MTSDSSVADGEMVFDLQVEGGTMQRGNDAVMVWPYSYQVVPQGGQAATRSR